MQAQAELMPFGAGAVRRGCCAIVTAIAAAARPACAPAARKARLGQGFQRLEQILRVVETEN